MHRGRMDLCTAVHSDGWRIRHCESTAFRNVAEVACVKGGGHAALFVSTPTFKEIQLKIVILGSLVNKGE